MKQPLRLHQGHTLASMRGIVTRYRDRLIAQTDLDPLERATIVVQIGCLKGGGFVIDHIRVWEAGQREDLGPEKDEMSFGRVMTQRSGVKIYRSLDTLQSDVQSVFGGPREIFIRLDQMLGERDLPKAE
jgi:hypothetical protein